MALAALTCGVEIWVPVYATWRGLTVLSQVWRKMPLPEYQRLLGCWLLSRTARTFEPPNLALAVKSHSYEMKPYGRAQSAFRSCTRCCPVRAIELDEDPLPLARRGRVTSFGTTRRRRRGTHRPLLPLSFGERGGEMLQSCGTSTEVQGESSNVVACAPVASPRWNFQEASKSTVVGRAPS